VPQGAGYFTLLSRHSLGNGTIKMFPLRSLRWGISKERVVRILHTSDWHLGRTLYERKRFEEFQAFLNWLRDVVVEERIDILLIAGDVFDTIAPGNRAQELYYSFLRSMVDSRCHDVVIIAGNHDSPSFLEAPCELLAALQVHVIGSTGSDLSKEVLVLNSRDGRPQAIVCAVPFLRDRDVRLADDNESPDDKTRNLVEGISVHYAQVAERAFSVRQKLGELPIIGMGHLLATGGKTLDGDGVRDLYIGSLGAVGAEIFPRCFNYVALGHLHVPQKVGGEERIRYCGSPLAMGFGEAGQQKEIVIVEFSPGVEVPAITIRAVQVFQRLQRIRGDIDSIRGIIAELIANGESVWLEIEYTGTALGVEVRDVVTQMVNGTAVEVLRIRNQRIVEQVLHRAQDEELLENLDSDEVFSRCLDCHQVEPAEREGLMALYREVVLSMQTEGSGQSEVQA
jgi:DNA repair protein SbcD/Mre11